MDGRLPTIDDVARVAGVGKGTASRVINASPNVSESTRQRVLAAIEQLNFRPSSTARRLSNNAATRQIGILEFFITAPAFVDRLRGIQEVVESQSGFELLLFSCRSPERYEPALARIAAHRSVEALLVADLKVSDRQAVSACATRTSRPCRSAACAGRFLSSAPTTCMAVTSPRVT